MSYLVEGPVGLLVGLALVLIFPIAGLLLIVFSIVMIAIGSSQERPGANAGLCSWLGHDWRKDLPGAYPGTSCRNCLRRKGAPAPMQFVGYVPVPPPGFAPPPPGAIPPPGYARAVAPQGPPPGYAPGYGPAMVMVAPPSAVARAAYAPPVVKAVCPACRSPVQGGMAKCPWCQYPLA